MLTTIFYDGNNLYADCLVVHDCYPSRIKKNGKKLHINESNTIAIGTCGKMPDAKEQEQMSSIANTIFKQIYADCMNHRTKFKENETLEDFIAITSNRAFVYRDGIVYPQTGFMTALGTGNRSIMACYYVVQDVATAFRISADIDNLSSPEYTYVMADSLNPFVVE